MSDSSLLTPLNQVPTDILTSSGGRFENRLQAARSAASVRQHGELKKAAQEFEAIFIAQMLKVMRETIEESGLTEGGLGKSIYTEMFDQEVSLNLAKKGALGIADILEKRLNATAAVKDKKDSTLAPSKEGANVPAGAAKAGADDASQAIEPDYDISDMQLPVQAPISSLFGMRRDPFTRQEKFHKGLDLAAPEGMAVVPALPGTVMSARYEPGYGNTVVVEHAGGIKTRYGHLGSMNVKAGDTITSDNILGTVGSTGRSTGAHLHFEVIRNGVSVDPSESLALHQTSRNFRAGS
jgi:murein DD-endopeptidase MepM/ murein hydrolase activator NlpD